jgi:glycosyltransferase involved in cell wall biosynthesis
MRRSSVLLIAQLGPPSEIVAARRVAGFAKYLSRLGHPVTVMTSARSGAGPIEGAVETIRTRDLVTTRLNWRKADGLGAPPGNLRGIERHVVPDIAAATWLPFLLANALALVRRDQFDCLITTSPPPTAHLVGPPLRRRGLRWIADLRDGWTFDPPRPRWPLAWQRRIDAALERGVLRSADIALGVTTPIVEDLRTRLRLDARLLTNGYDPDDREAIDPATARGLLSPDRHSLVHTGRGMHTSRSVGTAGLTPVPLLDALRVLVGRKPDVAARLEVVFAGTASDDERRLFADPDLRQIVRTVGTLPRSQALALQQAADSLLVVAAGSSEHGMATGKLFEYLTAGPPILVVGERSEAARIVAETGTGLAVPSDDPAAIAAGIARLIEGIAPQRRPDAVARYSWPVLAQQASQLIDEVCAREPSPRA